MANLAIKGHATRGQEVIEILEMLGGVNTHNLYGDEKYTYYTIDSDKEIKGGIYVFGDEDLLSFTLEEFLEKFPYKIGDKVLRESYVGARRICEMRWDADNNCIKYGIGVGEWFNVSQVQPYKEETMDRKYDVEEYLKVWKETEKGLEVVVNDRFELKEDNGKFYIIKKQPQYPKTYEECCNVLLLKPERATYSVSGLEYERHLIVNLQRLLICRDAYWKIAGEQVGLGKPWKPDWEKADERKYCIVNTEGNVAKWVQKTTNKILAFPTEEMRDVFYENFKGLIELCKELL